MSLRLSRRTRVLRRTAHILLLRGAGVTVLLSPVGTHAAQKVREQLMTSGNGAAVAPPIPSATPAQTAASSGLTSAEASDRLQNDGPNAMPDTSAHPLRNALAKFVANWQDCRRECDSGRFFPGLLYSDTSGRQVRNGARNRRPENSLCRCDRLWQPSHNLRHPRT